MSDRTYSEYDFDASVSRMTSAIVATVAFVAVLAHSVWLVAFLAIDYLMRGLGLGDYSLLERCGDELAHTLGLEPRMIDGAPERFSARLGFIAMFAATLLYALQHVPFGSALAAVVVLAEALEAGTGVRIGERFLSVLPERIAALLAR